MKPYAIVEIKYYGSIPTISNMTEYMTKEAAQSAFQETKYTCDRADLVELGKGLLQSKFKRGTA